MKISDNWSILQKSLVKIAFLSTNFAIQFDNPQ